VLLDKHAAQQDQPPDLEDRLGDRRVVRRKVAAHPRDDRSHGLVQLERELARAVPLFERAAYYTTRRVSIRRRLG